MTDAFQIQSTTKNNGILRRKNNLFAGEGIDTNYQHSLFSVKMLQYDFVVLYKLILV